MSGLIAHRGPDASDVWVNSTASVGMAHRRLAILDLSQTGAQPMASETDAVIVHNGEVYNFVELRQELSHDWSFRGTSDTEVILAAHEKWGDTAPHRFRGMYAYAVWSEKARRLVAVRDRFGIKPFYYAVVGRLLYFASEIKALLPFLPDIATDRGALSEYLTFQFTISDQTLFEHVQQLPQAHTLVLEGGRLKIERYWDVNYAIDWSHTPAYFQEKLRELLFESMKLHLRSDVPVGAYVSGGIDSSLIALLAAKDQGFSGKLFHGRFAGHAGFDESGYAQQAADAAGAALHTLSITPEMFRDHARDVIYHLDHPVAGPGAFPQYEVARLAASHGKVVLGGQGGDEIFGGYARYLVAYLEQCIGAAIDGTYKNGNFVVTLESIVPRLEVLREYKPMLRAFWKEGLFGPLDERYFRLIDRSADDEGEIDWSLLPTHSVLEKFKREFNRPNVGKDAYFDKMSHFDFKFLLPALLHVEDRVGMAHGLETRVPFLDQKLIEFAATIPADIKFKDGQSKHLLKHSFQDVLPRPILDRRDKMGFPVPLGEWFKDDLRGFARDVFGGQASLSRGYVDNAKVLAGLESAQAFSRKFWGFFSLEVWHQTFHDRAAHYRQLFKEQLSAPENGPQGPSPDAVEASKAGKPHNV